MTVKAFIGAVTQHGQATYRYIRANGVSRELMVMMLVQQGLFLTMHHDVHHRHTRIAPRYLPVVAEEFNVGAARAEQA